MLHHHDDLGSAVRDAIRHFWQTRARQARMQGRKPGGRDSGARAAVAGGAHLDGFANLLQSLVVSGGMPSTAIHRRTRVELPGYFRPEKKWDFVVVVDGQLLATIEFKAHVGPSFGNNYNNRTEEAIGSALDYWTAYREGAFRGSPRPWLGYLMLLEDAPGSRRAVSTAEPHFRVFEEFRNASYARRYELLLTKLVRERHYDSASLLLSPRTAARTGDYSEPNPELAFRPFAESLIARILAHARFRQ